MFRRLHEADGGEGAVTLYVEGEAVKASAGDTVAAAVLAAGLGHVRTMPGSGAPRGPYCLMGVCFDCLMEIDGVPNRQACMVTVTEGMRVRRQDGARSLDP